MTGTLTVNRTAITTLRNRMWRAGTDLQEERGKYAQQYGKALEALGNVVADILDGDLDGTDADPYGPAEQAVSRAIDHFFNA